jgi:hypothetical protein
VLIIPSSWGSQLGGYLPTSKTRAAPRPRRLRLHRLRHRHPSSTTTSMWLHHSSRALCAHGFICGYLDTGTPRHRPCQLLHSYHDQGCITHRSWLPRHRHKGYHLAWALLGFLYSPSICDATPSMMLPLWLWGCQPVGFYAFGFSPYWPSMMLQLFMSLPLWLRQSVRDILGSYRY